MRKYRSELIKLAETLDDLRKEAYEKLSDAIEEFNDKIERQKDIIKDLESTMKHYRNIIDIVGKDVLGISDELLKQMNRVSVEAAEKDLRISKAYLDSINADLAAARAELERLYAEGYLEDAKLMEKEIEEIEDMQREAQEKYMASWEDALNAATESFKDNMQIIADAFDKAVSGTAGSLDNLQEYFDMSNKVADQYLPTYERIYELNKLTRDVNNAINNTDNIKGKQRLRDLQEEILQAQREGTELSEYDVEFMQKRLELEIAQIAMEEARNAKNMVRMTRDNEGN